MASSIRMRVWRAALDRIEAALPEVEILRYQTEQQAPQPGGPLLVEALSTEALAATMPKQDFSMVIELRGTVTGAGVDGVEAALDAHYLALTAALFNPDDPHWQSPESGEHLIRAATELRWEDYALPASEHRAAGYTLRFQVSFSAAWGDRSALRS